MTDTKELERSDLRVDNDIEVGESDSHQIIAFLETWFNTDEKFGIHISADEGSWLNLYAIFNPYENTLKIECVISRDKGSEAFDYTPTESEAEMIKQMITEKIREEYHQTPQEFCEDVVGEDYAIGGM